MFSGQPVITKRMTEHRLHQKQSDEMTVHTGMNGQKQRDNQLKKIDLDVYLKGDGDYEKSSSYDFGRKNEGHRTRIGRCWI